MKHLLFFSYFGSVIIMLTSPPTLAAQSTSSSVNMPSSGHSRTANRSTFNSDKTTQRRGAVRLSPEAIHRNNATSFFQTNLDKLQKIFKKFSNDAASYESEAKLMLDVEKTCSTKSYSVQDQNAAGCTGSETLDGCMQKLYKYCIANYSISKDISLPGPIGPGLNRSTINITNSFSTNQFKKSALDTEAQARALSHMLSLYADEVEKNARSLVP